MDGPIILHGRQQQRLLELYRSPTDPALRLRAHINLLLAQGQPWALISTVLFCSSATIARWKERFQEEGVAGWVGPERGPTPRLFWAWAATAAGWVRPWQPSDFGFRRRRGCCATVVVLMLELHRVRLSSETVRRWLRRDGLVGRRPRPVLGPKDPDYPVKVARLRRVLSHLPANETAVFRDEVDLNPNPKIGSMGMPRGHQATVLTPGTNTKRYWAGSRPWPSGHVIVTPGLHRDGALFVAHLDDLRRPFRCYRKVHVICANARFHQRGAGVPYLRQWGHRLERHYLPLYAPQALIFPHIFAGRAGG